MLVYAIAVVAALAIPALTRGSYSRMLGVRWRLGPVLFAGLGIQIVLEYVTIPREHWHDVGFGLLVVSYVLILTFVARNLVLRGMGIVFIGIACNALVITVNHGMPFKVPPDWQGKPWAQATIKHHPRESDDRLVFLSDIIVLNGPFESVVSFGDLILAVGLCDVAYNASRKYKGRGPQPPRKSRKSRTSRTSRKAERASSRRSGRGPARGSRSIDLTESDETHTDEIWIFDSRDDAEDTSDVPPPGRGSARSQDAVLTRSRRTRSSATTTRSS